MRKIRPTKLDECRDTHLSSITCRTVGHNRKLTRISSPLIDISCCASRAKSPVRAILIANLSHAADQKRNESGLTMQHVIVLNDGGTELNRRRQPFQRWTLSVTPFQSRISFVKVASLL